MAIPPDDDWHFRASSWTVDITLGSDDLTLTVCEEELDPASLSRLGALVDRLPRVMADCVQFTCDARHGRLNWRKGPGLDDWAIIELRLERDGAFWLSLHEYETDEYALWLVRLDAEDRVPLSVRRAAYAPDEAPFSERGVAV